MHTYKYKINGHDYNVTIGEIVENKAQVEVNGKTYTVEMEKKETPAPSKPIARPAAKSQNTPKSQGSAPSSSNSKGGVKSPLPGVILDLKVKEGDMVKKGDTILILEAMKMENNINADRDGKITAVNVKNGDSVLEGTELVVIE